MRKTYVVILLQIVFVVHSLCAQQDTTQKFYALKSAPLSLLDPAQSAIQLGAEIRLYNNVSFQQEIGYITNTSYNANNIFPGRKGLKLRTEMRFYNRHAKELNGRYLAPEVFFSLNIYYREDSFERLDTVADWREIYKLHKILLGANLKSGYQRVFKSGLVLDFYYGLGIKFRSVQHLEKETPSSMFGYDQCFSCIPHKAGKYIVPNLTAGLKIGYAW